MVLTEVACRNALDRKALQALEDGGDAHRPLHVSLLAQVMDRVPLDDNGLYRGEILSLCRCGCLRVVGERRQTHRIVRKGRHDLCYEWVIRLVFELFDQDPSYDAPGVSTIETCAPPKRIIKQRCEIAVVARIRLHVPLRALDLMHAISSIETEAFGVQCQSAGILELCAIGWWDIEKEPARAACGEQFAQRLVKSGADTPRRFMWVAGDVLKIAVPEVRKVIDERETGNAMPDIHRS